MTAGVGPGCQWEDVAGLALWRTLPLESHRCTHRCELCLAMILAVLATWYELMADGRVLAQLMER